MHFIHIMGKNQLSNLVQMNSPGAVLDEVHLILDLISPGFDKTQVTSAFSMIVSLFEGNYPGYQACNTEYHDLRHTTDTFLAMARLIHGAVIDGKTFSHGNINLGLISTLFHDTGYIQKKYDSEGTGAKYTVSHVRRSIDFLEIAGSEQILPDNEIAAGQLMILCTDLTVDVPGMVFPSYQIELLSKMLGAADLLAQMADRTYLEKLLFLYREFKEAGVGGYENEVDLLQKTVGFYDFIDNRLKTMLDSTDRFMDSHFSSRWDIDKNLYHESINRQKDYLQQILGIPDTDHRNHLKRDGLVEKVRNKYGKNYCKPWAILFDNQIFILYIAVITR
ncbi:MAG: hypothetical protein U9Q38_01945 [Thermodesulfobacteriota bacterium]|nr:hypothetical protein [Thermodesulfobacteriota bacterium]